MYNYVYLRPKDECFYKELDNYLALKDRQRAINITIGIFGALIAVCLIGGTLLNYSINVTK